jgi:hypothetical protein
VKTIVVQQAKEGTWITKAMHLACALARNQEGHIVLLRLVLANNPGLLGWGITPPTVEEQTQIEQCTAIAQHYGIAIHVQAMQYVTYVDAMVQAASQFHAVALFAHIPSSRFPYWKRFQLWHLKRQLRLCPTFTLDESFIRTSKGYLFPVTIGDRIKAHK